MSGNRNRYGSSLKAKIALEAIRGEKTAAELAGRYEVHVSQITRWKKQAVERLPEIFSNKGEKDRLEGEKLQGELYKQIGRLKVELDWLKKKSGLED